LLLEGIFSSDAQRMPYRKDGNCMGDEGKAVGSAQAPAALLSPTPARRFRETLWPQCAASDQDFAMSALSQKQTFRCVAVMSALAPMADIEYMPQ
jgi:hypothetical protein